MQFMSSSPVTCIVIISRCSIISYNVLIATIHLNAFLKRHFTYILDECFFYISEQSVSVDLSSISPHTDVSHLLIASLKVTKTQLIYLEVTHCRNCQALHTTKLHEIRTITQRFLHRAFFSITHQPYIQQQILKLRHIKNI